MAAIYQWFVGHEIVVTTTLYPVDVTDRIVFGVRIGGGAMALLPNDEEAWSMSLEDGILQQERWFVEDGPYDDEEQWSMSLEEGVYQQERWFLEDGPYDDTEQWSMDLRDVTYANKLVRVDTGSTGKPYEELQLGARPGVGSLTLI